MGGNQFRKNTDVLLKKIVTPTLVSPISCSLVCTLESQQKWSSLYLHLSVAIFLLSIHLLQLLHK